MCFYWISTIMPCLFPTCKVHDPGQIQHWPLSSSSQWVVSHVTQSGLQVLTIALLSCARGYLHSTYHWSWESSNSTRWYIIQIQNPIPESVFLHHSWHQMSQVWSNSGKDNVIKEYSHDKFLKMRSNSSKLSQAFIPQTPINTGDGPPWERGMSWARQFSSTQIIPIRVWHLSALCQQPTQCGGNKFFLPKDVSW